jgi:hypothetical protein
MRGKTQAHLIAADDGCSYVVKFAANRNGGRRALVNEFVGSGLLSSLGIATPMPAFVEIGNDCVSDAFLPNGTHFGSRFRGDTVAVYDFLPKTLLHKLSNRGHFIGALMFDHWTSNADSRQAIFFRDLVKPSNPGQQGFIAEMIDNGSLFGGSNWTFQESASKVMYSRPEIYGLDLSIRDFAPWLDALTKLRPEVLSEAIAALPREWIHGDEQELDDLLSRLLERRMLLPAMIQQSVDLLRARGGTASTVLGYQAPHLDDSCLEQMAIGG